MATRARHYALRNSIASFLLHAVLHAYISLTIRRSKHIACLITVIDLDDLVPIRIVKTNQVLDFLIFLGLLQLRLSPLF